MKKTKQPRYYLPAIKAVRLLLIACAILFTFSTNSRFNAISTIVFSFAFPAMYTISGFLVLRESPNVQKRILRAIKRTAVCFVVLLTVYIGLSLLFESELTVKAISSKALWENLFLLNDCSRMLPIGSTIWYVIAMLYAYIIIFVIYKLRLLKLDIYIAALCLAVTAVAGDFSAVFGLPFYVSGNFVTRALPYILIGCFMQRKADFFVKIKPRSRIFIAAAGLLLSFAEYFLLDLFGKKVYFGHTIGTILTAVAVCLFAFSQKTIKHRSKLIKTLSRFELSIPFYVCSPVYYLCIILFNKFDFLFNYKDFISIAVMIISFAVLLIYYLIRPFFLMLKYRKLEQQTSK